MRDSSQRCNFPKDVFDLEEIPNNLIALTMETETSVAMNQDLVKWDSFDAKNFSLVGTTR